MRFLLRWNLKGVVRHGHRCQISRTFVHNAGGRSGGLRYGTVKLKPEWKRILIDLVAGVHRAVVITGGIGAGKTAFAVAAAGCLAREGWTVGGVVSPRILRDGVTVGYRVRDISSGHEMPLCSLNPPGIAFRRFYFSPEGLRFAREAILRARARFQVVVVDEVGPWELQGKGFYPALEGICADGKPLILTVRPHLREAIPRKLGLSHFRALVLD